MPPRGATSRHLFAPFFPQHQSPCTNPPSTNRLPAPILTSSLLYEQPPSNTSSPLPSSTPTNSPPSSLPILLSPHAPQSPYLGHLPPIYFAILEAVHSEYQLPLEPPHPTAYREPCEALSMLGVVYTCVHKSVHTCTVMYTRVYNRAFIPISF